VTCRDWFQLSLKEGFTVFRDQSFSADIGSAAVKRIDDVRLLKAVQFPEDAGPLAHPIRPDSYLEIANFDTSTRGDPWWFTVQFMKTMKIDRVAAGHLLAAFENAHPEWLSAFTMPTLVVCGTEDEDNGSATRLAEALPNATYAPVPGTHMSSVTKAEFGRAIADFLSA